MLVNFCVFAFFACASLKNDINCPFDLQNFQFISLPLKSMRFDPTGLGLREVIFEISPCGHYMTMNELNKKHG